MTAPAVARRSPAAATLSLFAVGTTLGGANFLAVRFSNAELPPFFGAGLRFSLAAVLFVAISLVLRLSWPRGRQLGLTAAYGAMTFAIPYALLYWALTRTTAGAATIVLASVPLVTLLLAALHGLERVRARGIVGAVCALGGILWLVLGPADVLLPLTALIPLLASTAAIGESIILGKRLGNAHPAMANAVGMIVGAALLLAFSAVVGETWQLPQQTATIWALAYLVTLGSVGLFVVVLLLVRHWTASATSYMFVLFPIVTLLLGALIADEPVTVHALAGAALVMAGVWFGALSPGARAPAAASGASARQA